MNCKNCGEPMIPAYCRNCERGKRAESGAKLRAQRVAAGLSLRALAKILGVSHVYLGEVERGDRAGHRLREAIKAELAKPRAECHVQGELDEKTGPALVKVVRREYGKLAKAKNGEQER